jgi:hypothetical protein
LDNLSADGTEVTIAWNYTSEFEQGFVILRNDAEVATVYDEFFFTDIGLTPNTTYTYTVYAFNELGNSEMQTLEVTTTRVGINGILTNELIVFPTITSDIVYLKYLPDNNRVQVLDALGRTLVDKKARDLHGVISLKNHADGIYFIKISGNNKEVKSVKVIKQ